MNRKQRREAAKQAKSQGNSELHEKISLFGKMPDHCMICQEDFDKMDKEQVMSRNVVVREKEDRVNLYCPQCWEKSLKFIEEIQEALIEKNNK